MSGFRKTCISFERVIGTFSAIPHPVAVEIAATSGAAFLCIDCEHAQIGRERVEDMIRAADLHRVPAMVRVPGHQPEAIASALDAGAAGVLVPRVSTAGEARAAVAATRFPPVGRRGVGPGRAAGYGYRIAETLKSANETVVLAIQIETAEGLANVEEIAAVEGIDVIFIGPGDLSVAIDAMGPDNAEKLNAAIRQIADTARAAGKAVGIFRPDGSDVAAWETAGISFYIIGSDAMMLASGLAAGLGAALRD
ncbi:HpcH/HpaI aldolase family protein [Martelella limonii]|uniref:HpcH/HpaI aldolase family protein n=1 Tax=Martelella limonii TaxID=1647649 RepID=UPI0015804F69|nr:aldolase/citrate lyase family protein [Martelella limonii]